MPKSSPASANGLSESTTLRRATKAEATFIKASWFESYRKGGMAPEVRYDVMRPHLDAAIDSLLQRATTWVLTPTQVPEEICGYVVFEAPNLHYLYVKQSYRKLGFASHLLSTFGPFKQHTHATTASKALLARHGSKYNPFLLNAAQPKEEFEWHSS